MTTARPATEPIWAVADPPSWWNGSWDLLTGVAPVGGDGRLGQVLPVVEPEEVGSLATGHDVLSLWPRLGHHQRYQVRDRLIAGGLGIHVDGPLLACLVAEAPQTEYLTPDPDERTELATLAELPIAIDALRMLAGNPDWVPGPLAETVVGERFAAAFAGLPGRSLRSALVDAAALSVHLTYDEAATLLTSDPELALARADAPFEDVVARYRTGDDPTTVDDEASSDWLVAKHPDCPPAVLEKHMRYRSGYFSLQTAFTTPVSAAYVRSALAHAEGYTRGMLVRTWPDAVLTGMDDELPIRVWKHLAQVCTPHRAEFVEAFMTHPAVPVRSAYVRAFPDHADVAARALRDPSHHVRTALARNTESSTWLSELAGDPNPTIRREAAQRLMRALAH